MIDKPDWLVIVWGILNLIAWAICIICNLWQTTIGLEIAMVGLFGSVIVFFIWVAIRAK